MKEIKYKECYVVGDCLHIQFVDGESYNFLLDSVVEEMVGGLTPLALDGAYLCGKCGLMSRTTKCENCGHIYKRPAGKA